VPSYKKFRMTPQRQAILEELRSVTSHPTADELYEMIRKRLPRISLGTVYRNLEILSESGLVQKLELGGSQKRFDGNVKNHYHVRCIRCGRVDDMPMAPLSSLEKTAREITDYEIVGHRAEFIGICPRCNRRKGETESHSSKLQERA